MIGNSSYDPDVRDKKESLQSLNLVWSCSYDNNSICEFLNGTKILIYNAPANLNMLANSLVGDMNYTFTLTASKGIRKTSYSVRIDMRSTITP